MQIWWCWRRVCVRASPPMVFVSVVSETRTTQDHNTDRSPRPVESCRLCLLVFLFFCPSLCSFIVSCCPFCIFLLCSLMPLFAGNIEPASDDSCVSFGLGEWKWATTWAMGDFTKSENPWTNGWNHMESIDRNRNRRGLLCQRPKLI